VLVLDEEAVRATPEGLKKVLSSGREPVVMNMMEFGYEMSKFVGLENRLGADRHQESVRTNDCIHGVTGNLHLVPREAGLRFR